MSALMTLNSPMTSAFFSGSGSVSMPGRPSFFFLSASRMSSGTMPFISFSSDDSCVHVMGPWEIALPIMLILKDEDWVNSESWESRIELFIISEQ